MTVPLPSVCRASCRASAGSLPGFSRPLPGLGPRRGLRQSLRQPFRRGFRRGHRQGVLSLCPCTAAGAAAAAAATTAAMAAATARTAVTAAAAAVAAASWYLSVCRSRLSAVSSEQQHQGRLEAISGICAYTQIRTPQFPAKRTTRLPRYQHMNTPQSMYACCQGPDRI